MAAAWELGVDVTSWEKTDAQTPYEIHAMPVDELAPGEDVIPLVKTVVRGL